MSPSSPDQPTESPTEHPVESVWDYPRPPALTPFDGLVEVVIGGRLLARTRSALRVLETSHPPTYYWPLADTDVSLLRPVGGRTLCEWKGVASYFDVVTDGAKGVARVAERAAWTYPEPTPGFAALRDHLSVMPGAMDQCRVDGEVVQAQEGDFYGGWVTSWITGPFKGGPGTLGW